MFEKQKIVVLTRTSQEKNLQEQNCFYLLTSTMLKIIVMLSITCNTSGKC